MPSITARNGQMAGFSGCLEKGGSISLRRHQCLMGGGEYANPLGFKTKEEAEKELEEARTDTEINVLKEV